MSFKRRTVFKNEQTINNFFFRTVANAVAWVTSTTPNCAVLEHKI